jgi:3-deoxy-D-manno-octulosonic-acid transferase
MGELPMFFASADAAFVGGSLVAAGGHNILEPAALGVPVVFGPYMMHFTTIADLFLEQGAARQIDDAESLARVVIDWFGDPGERARFGDAGRRVVEGNRGALEKSLDIVRGFLGPPP